MDAQDNLPSELPFQDEKLPPLDLEYARSVADEFTELERVQKALVAIPPNLIVLFQEASDDHLLGIATMGQAVHDLAAKEILMMVGRFLESKENNPTARTLASNSIMLVAIMEALSYIACKELVDRHADEA